MEHDRKKQLIPLPRISQNILMTVCLIAAAILLGVGLFAPITQWLKIFCFAASVLLAGFDLALDAVMKLVRERDFDGNLLVVLAAIVAFLIGKAAEGAAVMVLYRAGEFFAKLALQHVTNSIEMLLDRRPDVVNAVVAGAIVRRSAGKIKVGDVISVAPGEQLVLDGTVISGSSEIDTVVLTGESTRLPVSYGSEVLSGSLNLTGVLNVRVTSEFDNSTVSRMMKLIEMSESRKSRPEKLIARVTRLYTPAVVAAALIIGVIVPLLGGLPFIPWLSRALGFLVVSYTFDLARSIPLTYFAGICGASRKGIIFRGASVVDDVAHVTSVIFEKTGTLTTGRYQVRDVQSCDISSERLLFLAAYAEAHSNHPMARAIVAEAGFRPDLSRISGFREIPGKGTAADIGGVTVSAGNALLMEDLGITPNTSQDEAIAVYIAVNNKYAGRILLVDALKQDAQKAVRELRGNGVDRIAIFTGDKKETAADVADRLGIQEYYADCLPDEKVTKIKGLTEMQLPGDKLIYVGDGLSDAPVLKTADVGVSIGGLGPDEAVEAADMIIMTDEPSKMTSAILIARETNDIVRQNIIFCLALRGLLLLLILLGLVSMWLAVIADAAVAILAVWNARRAFGMRAKDIRKALVEIKRSSSQEGGAPDSAGDGKDEQKPGKNN